MPPHSISWLHDAGLRGGKKKEGYTYNERAINNIETESVTFMTLRCAIICGYSFTSGSGYALRQPPVHKYKFSKYTFPKCQGYGGK